MNPTAVAIIVALILLNIFGPDGVLLIMLAAPFIIVISLSISLIKMVNYYVKTKKKNK